MGTLKFYSLTHSLTHSMVSPDACQAMRWIGFMNGYNTPDSMVKDRRSKYVIK